MNSLWMHKTYVSPEGIIAMPRDNHAAAAFTSLSETDIEDQRKPNQH